MSAEQWPTNEEIKIVERAIQALLQRCEKDAKQCLLDVEPLLEGTKEWRRSDAFLWLLLVQVRSMRYLSLLEDCVSTAERGIESGDAGLITTHLQLEVGMALNEMGEPRRSECHLIDAVERYRSCDDANGEAWALTALAVSASFTESYDPIDLLNRALEISSEDAQIRPMIWHRLSIAHRQKGEIEAALAAIETALQGARTSHSRSNYQLERGHLLAWIGQFSASDDDYVAALDTFLSYGDLLGAGNAERALANNALRLGRNREGLRRLEGASRHLREVQNSKALATVLRDKALLLAEDGQVSEAIENLTEARVELESSDPIGLASVERAFARIYNTAGHSELARSALRRAVQATDDTRDTLGRAANYLLLAEVAESHDERARAAESAADLYAQVGLPQGEANAAGLLVEALANQADTPGALAAMRRASAAWHQARTAVADPGRRADQDNELYQVTRAFMHATAVLNDPAVALNLADHLVDLAPLGLRAAFADGLDDRVRNLGVRLSGTDARRRRNPKDHRPGLQELAAVLATLRSGGDVPRPTFRSVTSRRPTAAHLFVGPPTSRKQIPIAWNTPSGPPHVTMVELSEADVVAIEGLASTAVSERDLLWSPSKLDWTSLLARVLIPLELAQWLEISEAPELVVHLTPLLAHLPIEAFDVGGHPLGAQAAVSRLCSTTAVPSEPNLLSMSAFLDPSLPWTHERRILGDAVQTDEQLRSHLGPNQLIHYGCHGSAAPRTEGCLETSDRRCVSDSLDLLASDLTGSVVVLEACYTRRHVGHRHGETLDLATISMLAGAAGAVAGLFALPADDACTGRIVADLLGHLTEGVPPAEALRRARLSYLREPPEELKVPGKGDRTMAGSAPWSWAGLVAITR